MTLRHKKSSKMEEKKAGVEYKDFEVKEKEIKKEDGKLVKPTELHRVNSEVKEIMKALTVGKELTEKHKEFLKEKGMYEYKETPKEVPPPPPETEEAPERMYPSKISIKTPAKKPKEIQGYTQGYTIEDLKKIYQDLKEDKIHGPNNGLYCFNPCCLCRCYKQTHKKSKINKDNFFFVWLLILTGHLKKKNDKEVFKYNWKFTEGLIFQISGREFPKVVYPNKNEKYRVLSKYKKVLFEAYKIKIEIIKLLNDPKIKSFIYTNGYHMALRKYMGMDEMQQQRIFNFIKEKKEVTQRQLERRFSKVRLKKLKYYLSLLECEEVISWDRYKMKICHTGKDRQISNPFDEIIEEIKQSLI